MVSRPPLAALRAFEAAARHKSLSKAAEELNVTHAAVAQHVRKLESWFETSLIQRAGKGIDVTARGAILANGLSKGFSRIWETIDAFTIDQTARPLNITATPSFTANWLLPRLGSFRENNPGVELMINPSAEVVDLLESAHDVAFRFGAGEWPGLISTPLLASDVALVASPCLIKRVRIAEPSDLLNLPWIQELGSDEIRFWLTSLGIDAHNHTDIINLPGNIAIDAIRSGVGIGKVSSTFVADDLAAGRLVRLFPGQDDNRLGYHLVCRPGIQRPALKRFIAWAKNQAEAPKIAPKQP